MYKTYKYRIYPNKQQEEQIQKTFGCVRFVYNQVLAYKKEKYNDEKISLSRIDCNNWKNQVLKKEYPWLKEVDKFSLENAIINLDNAYKNFFNKISNYPKFKKKHNNKKSYKTNFCNGNIVVSFDKNKIKLPKLKWVKAKIHREFEGKIKAVTVMQVPSGKYFAFVLVETEHIPMKSTECMVGVDLGIKHLLITSDGETFDNIRVAKQYENKLAKEQRKLSRKVKGSNNWNKQRIKVAKVYEKIHTNHNLKLLL